MPDTQIEKAGIAAAGAAALDDRNVGHTMASVNTLTPGDPRQNCPDTIPVQTETMRTPTRRELPAAAADLDRDRRRVRSSRRGQG